VIKRPFARHEARRLVPAGAAPLATLPTRSDILPALRRPGFYAGPQGSRPRLDWYADAVVNYLGNKR
jgi:hypothetical protein